MKWLGLIDSSASKTTKGALGLSIDGLGTFRLHVLFTSD